MEQLISLFREPDYESWSPSDPNPPPARAEEEPLYFRQLLQFLREQKEQPEKSSQRARARRA
jgi:hypothetical protein